MANNNQCLAFPLSSGATAGKLWIITSMSGYNDGGSAGRAYLAKLINTTAYEVTSEITLGRWEGIHFHGILILDSGEKIQAYFGATEGATDLCYLFYNGYQIDKY